MLGRNDPCDCGSGRKFKQCCMMKTSRQYILAHAAEYELAFCGYTKEAFDDAGIGSVVVVRKYDDDKYITINLLCDIYCLGIKNAFIKFVNTNELDDFYEHFTFNMTLIEIPYETARSIALGSKDYAKNLGITPHPDFFEAGKVIESERAYDSSLWNEFGVEHNGRYIPLYQPGPYDKKEKILKCFTDKGLLQDKDFLYLEGPMMGTSMFL